MSDEALTNAAVERFRLAYDYLNTVTELPSGWLPGQLFTDDFLLDDRRKGGLSFGQLDASSYVRALQEFWRVGGQPHFSIVEVIAVRGEQCAAYVEKVVFGSGGMYNEHILVVELDEVVERSQRWVQFDPYDRDAAIAELDRMHAEIADEPDTPS